MAIDPQSLAGIVAGGGALGWMIFKSVQEKRKTSAAGLKENPVRCQEHQDRLGRVDDKLGALEQRAARLETRMDNLDRCANEIKDELRDLRERK